MDNRETPTLVVTIVFFVLASVFVALRFVSRLGVVHKVAAHDYLMLLAWVGIPHFITDLFGSLF
jgi:hypothetical protein